MFEMVDVFSIISPVEDLDVGAPREAALDYEVWFADLTTGTGVNGVPVLVFIPGWTLATGTDDYVTRWVPSTPGFYNAIEIEPTAGVLGHDQIVEIDAVVAYVVPEPGTTLLIGCGFVAFAVVRGRRMP